MRRWSSILAWLGLLAMAVVSGAHQPLPPPIPIRITTAAFTPDGRRVLVLYETGNLEAWSAATGQVLQTLNVPVAGAGTGTTLTGKALLSARPKFDALNRKLDDGSVVLETWDTTCNDPRMVLEHAVGEAAAVATVAVSADGRRALTGHSRALRLWDLTSGELVRSIEGKSCNPSAVAISPDGKLGLSLAHGSVTNSMVILWDLDTGEAVRTFEGIGDEWGSPMAFSPDGRWAVARKRTTWNASHGVLWKDWTVIWEVATGKAVRLFDDSTFLAFAPDSQHVLLRHQDCIRLWNFVEGQEKWKLPKNEDWATVAFSLDGKTLLTIGGARYSFGSQPDATRAALWDADTGRLVRVLKRPIESSPGPVIKPADQQANTQRWTWKNLFKWK